MKITIIKERQYIVIIYNAKVNIPREGTTSVTTRLSEIINMVSQKCCSIKRRVVQQLSQERGLTKMFTRQDLTSWHDEYIYKTKYSLSYDVVQW